MGQRILKVNSQAVCAIFTRSIQGGPLYWHGLPNDAQIVESRGFAGGEVWLKIESAAFSEVEPGNVTPELEGVWISDLPQTPHRPFEGPQSNFMESLLNDEHWPEPAKCQRQLVIPLHRLARLEELLSKGARIAIRGLPDDARVVECRRIDNTIRVAMESAEFPPVPYGELLPIIEGTEWQPIMRYDDAKFSQQFDQHSLAIITAARKCLAMPPVDEKAMAAFSFQDFQSFMDDTTEANDSPAVESESPADEPKPINFREFL